MVVLQSPGKTKTGGSTSKACSTRALGTLCYAYIEHSGCLEFQFRHCLNSGSQTTLEMDETAKS